MDFNDDGKISGIDYITCNYSRKGDDCIDWNNGRLVADYRELNFHVSQDNLETSSSALNIQNAITSYGYPYGYTSSFDSINLPVVKTAPEGKFFAGWSTTPNATAPEYTDTFIPAPDGAASIDLYPVYLDFGKLNFHEDISNLTEVSGLESTASSVSSIAYRTPFSDIALPSVVEVPEGKGFAGWATTPDATVADYTESYTPTELTSVDLYPVYGDQVHITCTVTIHYYDDILDEEENLINFTNNHEQYSNTTYPNRTVVVDSAPIAAGTLLSNDGKTFADENFIATLEETIATLLDNETTTEDYYPDSLQGPVLKEGFTIPTTMPNTNVSLSFDVYENLFTRVYFENNKSVQYTYPEAYGTTNQTLYYYNSKGAATASSSTAGKKIFYTWTVDDYITGKRYIGDVPVIDVSKVNTGYKFEGWHIVRNSESELYDNGENGSFNDVTPDFVAVYDTNGKCTGYNVDKIEITADMYAFADSPVAFAVIPVFAPVSTD